MPRPTVCSEPPGGRVAASAVDTAQRFESLARIGQAVSESPGLEEILASVAQAATQLLPDSYSAIWVAEGDVLRLAAEAGARSPRGDDMQVELAVGEGLVGHAAATGELLLSEDAPADPRARNAARLRREGLVAFAAVPLLVKDKLVGVLSLAARHAHSFSLHEMEVLGAFGDQAAIAIENARLYATLSARVRRLHALTRLNQLISSSLDPDDVLQEIADAAGRLMEAPVVMFCRAEEETRTFRLVASSSPEAAGDFPLPVLSYDRGIVGAIAAARAPIAVPDVFVDGRFLALDWWRAHGLRSFLGFPVLLDGSLLAVLTLNDRRPFRVAEEDRELLDSFVAQAAVALRNARLFADSERRRRAAEALQQVGRELAQLRDPRGLGERVVASVLELIDAKRATLYRPDPATGDLVVLAEAGSRPIGWTLPRGVGVSGLAAARRRPVASRDVLADTRLVWTTATRDALEQSPWRAVLAVPLLANDRLIGVLTAASETGRVYEAEEIALAQAFADQAALAFENAELLHESRERQGRLETLLDVTRQLTGISSLESLLDAIADACGRVLGSGSVGFRIVQGDELVVVGTSGHAASLLLKERLKIGESLSGRVARTGEPLIVHDLPESPDLAPEHREAALRSPFRAYLGVPVKIGDRVAGVLSIRKEHGFTQAEVGTAMAFAAQAAIALRNAQLYDESERRRRDAETLLEITSALGSSLELDDIFRIVARRTAEALGADRCTLRLQRRNRLVPVISLFADGTVDETLARRAAAVRADGVGVFAEAIRTRRPVIVEDCASSALVPPDWVEIAGIRSALVVPLFHQGAFLGVLTVDRATPSTWAREQVDLAVTIANQTALAIENARLFAAQREEAETAGALLRLTRAVEAVQDLDAILEAVVTVTPQLLGLRRCGLFLFDPADGALWPITTAGCTAAQQAAFFSLRTAATIPALAEAIRSHEPVVVEDATEDTWIPREVSEALDVRSMLIIPLVSGGRLMGVMIADAPGEARTFDDKQIALARGIAGHAAGAIDRAQLNAESERRRREAEVFAELARTINASLDLDTVLQHVAEWARELCRADAATSGLREPGSDAVVFRFWCGRPTGTVVRVEPGKGTGGRVLVTGRPFRTADYSSDARITKDYLASARADGVVAQMVVPIRSGDRIEGLLYLDNRSPRPFTDRDEAVLVRLAQHAAIAIRNSQLFAREQTARAQAEASEDRLRESQRFLRSTLDALSAHIAVLDETGTIIAVNAAWRRFAEQHGLGGPAHSVGDNYLGVCDAAQGPGGEHARAVAAGIRRVVSGEESEFRLEYEAHGPDARRWFAVRVTRFPGPGPVRVVVAHEDVTDRRAAEEALKRNEEQVRQMQKLEAIGRLAGGIAHDFNNLLTVISGRTQLLLRRTREADPMRRDLALIRETAERATGLTRQLLAFSRKQVLQPRVADLGDIVAGLVPMLRRLLGEDVELATTRAPGAARVKADPGQIEQVIVNLAVNARDAMPRGGRLEMEIGCLDLDEATAERLGGAAPGPYAMLAVKDSGIGMDAQTRSRIFEPFFTTKEVGQGTGLGLATVYGIVQQHQGCIDVESEPGKGTTFRVYLPATTESPAPTTAERPAGLPGGSETVLLVEDEHEVRALARDILQQAGYTVLEAANGVEAIEIGRGYARPIDLLVTDVIMPHMSGPELAERLMLLRPGMRALYMSGYTDDALAPRALLDSDRVLLQKPFTPESLAFRVREALDRA